MSDEKPKKQKAPQEKGGKGKQAAAPERAEKAERVKAPKERVVARLSGTYKNEVIPTLMKRFQYRNVMQVPRLEKISINIGVGQATQDPKLVEVAAHDLELIAGQKVVTDLQLGVALAVEAIAITWARARMR